MGAPLYFRGEQMHRNDNYLAHYGVKGMHWGIRRYQPYSITGGRKSGKAGKEIGQAAKKGAKAGASAVKKNAPKVGRAVKKAAPYAFGPTRYVKGHKMLKQKRYEKSDYAKAKKMSDKELRDRINRINLEQSYVQAMQRDRAAYREATQSVLDKNGRKAVKYVTGIPNNKEFKKRAAKKAAIAVGL